MVKIHFCVMVKIHFSWLWNEIRIVCQTSAWLWDTCIGHTNCAIKYKTLIDRIYLHSLCPCSSFHLMPLLWYKFSFIPCVMLRTYLYYTSRWHFVPWLSTYVVRIIATYIHHLHTYYIYCRLYIAMYMLAVPVKLRNFLPVYFPCSKVSKYYNKVSGKVINFWCIKII